MQQPSPSEVRAARSFLRQNGIPSRQLSPRLFALAAKSLSMTFKELLRDIGERMDGGQGQALKRRKFMEAEQKRVDRRLVE